MADIMTGDRVTNRYLGVGLVVSTSRDHSEALVSWDNEEHGRRWISVRDIQPERN
jgi:hypothetical protein